MDQKVIQYLLDTYKLPLYVFEESVLRERVRCLRKKLPAECGLCFAVKANPFLGEFLNDDVDRFEICSPGEMYICESVSLPAEKYVLSGVNKDEESMRHAFERGLCAGILTVESLSQFELIRTLAGEYHTEVRIMPRLTSGNQFGMEEDEIIGIVREISSEEYLSFAGVQFFSGTQKTSLKKIRRELLMLDDFIDRILEETGVSTPELEYGPGFPAVYFEGEEFDEEAYLDEFSDLLCSMRNHIPVMLELGRGIAASCGSLMSRVADVKCNHNNNYAILDSGIHHLAYYGQFMAMKRPILELWPQRQSGNSDPEWTLCGSLCTVNDLLVKKLPVHDLKKGDVVIFHNTGAYSMTEGISLFLSRDLPSVVWVKESGETKLLRDSLPTWKMNYGRIAD